MSWSGGGGPREVAGEWPGLGPEQRRERRDLKHTTDFREIMAEDVTVHLGNENIEEGLPRYDPPTVGLFAREPRPRL